MQEQVETQRIPVKVYRTSDRITVAAPMPGLQPEDIAVEVTPEGSLMLFGELRGALKGVKDLLVDEWNVGEYRRTLDLPAPVDGETANVSYGNGVLVVALVISDVVRPARLTMTSTGLDHGSHAGHAGHGMAPAQGRDGPLA
jgi:HSP20 family protein